MNFMNDTQIIAIATWPPFHVYCAAWGNMACNLYGADMQMYHVDHGYCRSVTGLLGLRAAITEFPQAQRHRPVKRRATLRTVLGQIDAGSASTPARGHRKCELAARMGTSLRH